MCISSNVYTEKNYKLELDSLTYNKSFKDVMEEQLMVDTAEAWLESHGIKVKTDMYGYYRNTFDILKDFGEQLSKNDKCCAVNLVEAKKNEHLL